MTPPPPLHPPPAAPIGVRVGRSGTGQATAWPPGIIKCLDNPDTPADRYTMFCLENNLTSTQNGYVLAGLIRSTYYVDE